MKNSLRNITFSDICLALIAMVTMTSCTKYDIVGSSDLLAVDGRKLYLRSINHDNPQGLDSCDVVHGKFKFSGNLDSVQVVMLCMDNEAVIPVVLEDGKINVKMNAHKTECTGTPLNDTLTAFNNKYRQLLMQMADLPRQQSQAIMNAEDMDEVNRRLAITQQQLLTQEDKLISGFIADNFDNCLAPYVFLLATESYQYPILTPWIEALMVKATDTFKNNPIIKEYMKAAQHNQDVMSGAMEANTLDIPQTPEAAPTPNEMAQPEE